MIKAISMFNIFYKSAVYKKGSLLLTSVGSSISFQVIITELMKGVVLKDMVVPILISIIGLLFFVTFSIADLISGLYAARHLSKTKVGYVKSHKLYRTLWKILGVALLTFLLACLSIVIKIADLDFLNCYKLVLIVMIMILVLACGFEFHSIGENIEKRTGRKPKIFNFFEIFLTKVQDGVINRVTILLKP